MSQVNFKYGTQEQYDAAVKDENTIYTVSDPVGGKKSGTIYKGEEIIGSTVTDNLYVDSSITVTGVTVGNFKSGDVIAPGTSVSAVLQKMLMKEIDVTATKPTATLVLTGTPAAGSYEAGTKVSVVPSHSYTDGKFTGQSGYSYTLAAGCAEGAATLTLNGEAIEEGVAQDFVLGAGSTAGSTDTQKFSLSVAYGANSNTPKTNFDNDSKVTIAAGSTVASTKTYTGYANMFIVHVADETSEINSGLIRGGKAYKEGTASANYNAPAGTCRTIVAMRKDSLSSASGNLGAGITASFIKQGSKVTVYGATTDWSAEYNVWVYSRPAISEEETININF